MYIYNDPIGDPIFRPNIMETNYGDLISIYRLLRLYILYYGDLIMET